MESSRNKNLVGLNPDRDPYLQFDQPKGGLESVRFGNGTEGEGAATGAELGKAAVLVFGVAWGAEAGDTLCAGREALVFQMSHGR